MFFASFTNRLRQRIIFIQLFNLKTKKKKRKLIFFVNKKKTLNSFCKSTYWALTNIEKTDSTFFTKLFFTEFLNMFLFSSLKIPQIRQILQKFSIEFISHLFQITTFFFLFIKKKIVYRFFMYRKIFFFIILFDCIKIF